MHIENTDVMEAQNFAAIEQHIRVINNTTHKIKKNHSTSEEITGQQ